MKPTVVNRDAKCERPQFCTPNDIYIYIYTYTRFDNNKNKGVEALSLFERFYQRVNTFIMKLHIYHSDPNPVEGDEDPQVETRPKGKKPFLNVQSDGPKSA